MTLLLLRVQLSRLGIDLECLWLFNDIRHSSVSQYSD